VYVPLELGTSVIGGDVPNVSVPALVCGYVGAPVEYVLVVHPASCGSHELGVSG
jgi:hypothetical protein